MKTFDELVADATTAAGIKDHHGNADIVRAVGSHDLARIEDAAHRGVADGTTGAAAEELIATLRSIQVGMAIAAAVADARIAEFTAAVAPRDPAPAARMRPDRPAAVAAPAESRPA